MDFYTIGKRTVERGPHKGESEIFADFRVGRSKDLMVRGRSFYAIWDEQEGLWSTDEYAVQRIVDEELDAHADKMDVDFGKRPVVRHLQSFGSNSWSQFRKYMQNISDNSRPLNDTLTFADTEVKKSDYVSKRLPYSLTPGDFSAWDELVGTLYNTEERAKIEWAIGAIVSGDAKKIQKFLVLYGPAGTGKSTILNIVEKLFEGYTTTFEAKALGSSGGTFATEVFKDNPLVAIQHDGDLSRIDDNTKLNSIISHENMPMNEKFKPGYTSRVNAFLLMGTNQPVKISDAKSGIIRRLIDVHPTGVKIPTNHYHSLMSRIDFELGAIAHHCLEVYRDLGKNYYSGYRPLEMMLQTDVFFNFIEAHYDIFKEQNSTSLKQAYTLYKEWCEDAKIPRVLPQYKFREELRNYFDEFRERGEVDGQIVRSYYSGFNASKFKEPKRDDVTYSLVLDETVSLLDDVLAEQPAQGSKEDADGHHIPQKSWRFVKTKLKDIETTELHYVKVPENHIVIDFDLKDENGEKSLERNLEAASVWPATYAERSQGGGGIHLHYLYDGDVSELSPVYSEGIEVKTLLGDSSLRRRLTKCNNIPVATLQIRLPLKEKKVLSETTIKSEKGLRDLIARNLRKEIHAGTKPSVDFIHKILEDAYASGMPYDVTDLRATIVAFANNSSNQPLQSLKTVQKMKFKNEGAVSVHDNLPIHPDDPTIDVVRENDDPRLAFFDLEIYPNLFVVCWKFAGKDASVVRMINPSAQEIEQLLKLKLVGYYCRRYDNHILYAAYMGYNIEALYELSQKIIEKKDQSAMFGEAYNLSYADIWEFSSKKQSLKKFQIDLGIPHKEMDLPWDQPVPEDRIDDVVEYCCNDVTSSEAVFEDRKQDFVARQVLADLSGLAMNNTTQRHTAQIIFGNDRKPQSQFKYTDLSKEFPGYEFDLGKSTYRGEDPSEGGYIYAEPGMYDNVAVLDVASMHPTSVIQLNMFGDEYTPRFKALLDARMAIKHKDYDSARKMMGGMLEKHLGNVADAEALSYALKIVINIVYGMTSAKFDNPFRDIRNVDNIAAKRGALFMIDLKHFVQERGFQVVHIKTDSIKIPNATPEIIDEVSRFGEKYGYNFEHEVTYEKFCLVNDAVYIAKKNVSEEAWGVEYKWDAVGAQFQHPYVFKKLFSNEDVEFNDLCETKQVAQGAMYLDFEHDRPAALVEGMHFVGRTGRFVPIREGFGGGMLYRVKDGKNYAVAGTKGYLWTDADVARHLPDGAIDMTYFDALEDAAIETINKFGNFESFVS